MKGTVGFSVRERFSWVQLFTSKDGLSFPSKLVSSKLVRSPRSIQHIYSGNDKLECCLEY